MQNANNTILVDDVDKVVRIVHITTHTFPRQKITDFTKVQEESKFMDATSCSQEENTITHELSSIDDR